MNIRDKKVSDKHGASVSTFGEQGGMRILRRFYELVLRQKHMTIKTQVEGFEWIFVVRTNLPLLRDTL